MDDRLDLSYSGDDGFSDRSASPPPRARSATPRSPVRRYHTPRPRRHSPKRRRQSPVRHQRRPSRPRSPARRPVHQRLGRPRRRYPEAAQLQIRRGAQVLTTYIPGTGARKALDALVLQDTELPERFKCVRDVTGRDATDHDYLSVVLTVLSRDATRTLDVCPCQYVNTSDHTGEIALSTCNHQGGEKMRAADALFYHQLSYAPVGAYDVANRLVELPTPDGQETFFVSMFKYIP